MDELAHQVLSDSLQRAHDDVRWLLEDVGEEDCFWEPASPCWSVRRRSDAERGWGRGEWVCEDGWPPPDPLPVTSIAWRVAHLAAWIDVYRSWTFEEGDVGLDDADVRGDRDGLVSWLVAAQDAFARCVGHLAPGELTEMRPAHWGGELPVHRLVAIIAYENVHHGAEIGVLRDLRRGHARLQPPPV